MGTLLLAAEPASAQKTTFPNYIPFNAAPEGVAVDKVGNVFVSIPGQILKFTPSGEKSVLVDLGPSTPAGLAVDAIGNVFAARPFGGVSRVDRRGNAELLPGTEWIALANGLAFDPEGNLYVTESFSFDGGSFGQGGIWRIPPGRSAEVWLRDELLTGLGTTPGLPFPIGANGIAYYKGALYVVNTERGIVVRISVLPSGDPGTIEVAAPVPIPYPSPVPPGADGLALDVHGNFYLAMPSHNVVVRMSPDGKSWETIGTAADFLDAPGSLAFGTGKGERTSLFITSMSMFPGGAGPGLVKIEAGVPGLPLP